MEAAQGLRLLAIEQLVDEDGGEVEVLLVEINGESYRLLAVDTEL